MYNRPPAPPDPFALPVPPQGYESNSNTNGLTLCAPISTAEKNIVIIAAGQSLVANTSGALYVPANVTKVNNVNIYDGASYRVGGPMLSCSNSTIGPGNLCAYLADRFITNGIADRVWIAPIGVGGTAVADWQAGGFCNSKIDVTMRRLASRGITPATPNTYFVFCWAQGETDNERGTSQAAYTASLHSMLSSLTASGFSGRVFINLETLFTGGTAAGIRAAQVSVVNNTTIFQGGDLDTLTGGTNRQPDFHLTAAGASAAATLMYNAIHVTGAPF